VAGDRLEALYRVALSLELRKGEVLGLRWQDVDLVAQTLRVTGAMQ
jgi:integrase